MLHPRAIAVVADDHELFCAGLSAMLKRDLGFDEVFEAGSLDEAVEHLSRNEVAFASFDLMMPGVTGMASLQGVREVFPSVRVAVVTASTQRENMLLALQAGMHGYVPKTFGIPEIARAIRQVMDGHVFVPPCLAELPLGASDLTAPHSEKTLVQAFKAELTLRQREVLRLMAEGKSNKEIARALGLAESTVKVHVNALFRTLGVHNRLSAIGAAAELGLALSH
jgi:DNA-binding NarL/FixJ family response regulator